MTSKQLLIVDIDGDEMTVTADKHTVKLQTASPYVELTREDVEQLMDFLEENLVTDPPEIS